MAASKQKPDRNEATVGIQKLSSTDTPKITDPCGKKITDPCGGKKRKTTLGTLKVRAAANTIG